MLKMSLVDFVQCFSHPELSFLTGSQELWAAFYGAQGPSQVLVSNLGQGRTGERSVLLFFLHVFMLGFLVEETLVNTGRTCKLHIEWPGR